MGSRTLNVSFHGHGLADYGEWWKRQYGVEGRNLAEVFTRVCIDRGIDIYTLTNEPFSNFRVWSRFKQVREQARNLPKTQRTRFDILGENAFVVELDKKPVIFLDGQSLRINHHGRLVELLTVGTGEIPYSEGGAHQETNFGSFLSAINYLRREGLPVIAEHPFAQGHYGALDKLDFEQFCSERSFDAVEHNGKLAVPNWLSFLPKFGGFTRRKNTIAVAIADQYGIPVIANDDADTIPQIGTAYTILPARRIRTDTGEHIIQDAFDAIKERDFSIHTGYTSFKEWMIYAVWNIQIRDHILKSREKYEAKLTK